MQASNVGEQVVTLTRINRRLIKCWTTTNSVEE